MRWTLRRLPVARQWDQSPIVLGLPTRPSSATIPRHPIVPSPPWSVGVPRTP